MASRWYPAYLSRLNLVLHHSRSGMRNITAIAPLLVASIALLGAAISGCSKTPVDPIRVFEPIDTIGSFVRVPAEIIIKFSNHALDRSVVCYTYPPPPYNFNDSLRSAIMRQRFPINGNVLTSRPLRDTILSFGGDHLKRMTSANACADTISIARNGDTLRTDDYNWMVLVIADSSSRRRALAALREFTTEIHLAE
jgi:hypothetical protein